MSFSLINIVKRQREINGGWAPIDTAQNKKTRLELQVRDPNDRESDIKYE